MTTATIGGRRTVGCGLGELCAEFPGWRIWRSRPRGLWWATRRGNVQYHDEPRCPGWGITVGGVATLDELGAQLAAQCELDQPPGDAPRRG
jgi:hypothetical protein